MNKKNIGFEKRFEIIKSIQGGMGIIHISIDHAHNDRPVALKTIRPEFLRDLNSRTRFIEEANIWIHLGIHQNIVQAYEIINNIERHPFIILELIPTPRGKNNPSLASWIYPNSKISIEKLLSYSIHISRGMKYTVSKIPNLVHRDLKPSNILINVNDCAMITDFGLAKCRKISINSLPSKSYQSIEKNKTRGVVGTPLYMAPEQWTGAPIDIRTDIYAFGCIMFEMYTGKPVIQPTDLEKIAQDHCAGFAQEAVRRVSFPDLLGDLILQCLSVNPNDRLLSWSDLEKELLKIYKNIIHKTPPVEQSSEENEFVELRKVGMSYIGIGAALKEIGLKEDAKRYFIKSLEIGEKNGYKRIEMHSLARLGNIYKEIDPNKANKFFRGAIDIAFQEKDFYQFIINYNDYSVFLFQTGNIEQAFWYSDEALKLSKPINDPYLTIVSTLNVAESKFFRNQIDEALSLYQNALEISQKSGFKRLEALILGNLGNFFVNSGELQKGIEYSKKSKTIASDIGDHTGVCRMFINIGQGNFYQNNFEESIKNYDKAISLAKQIQDTKTLAIAIGSIGLVYMEVKNYSEAFKNFITALKYAKNIKNKKIQLSSYLNLGWVNFELKNFQEAKSFFSNAITLALEIQSPYELSQALWNMGQAYDAENRFQDAAYYFKSAINVMKEIGHKDLQYKTYLLHKYIREKKL